MTRTEAEIESLVKSLRSVAAFDTLCDYESVSKKVTIQYDTEKRIKFLNNMLMRLQEDVAAISTSAYRTFLLDGKEKTMHEHTRTIPSHRVLSPNSVREIVGSIRHVWLLRRAFSGTSPEEFLENIRARVTAVNRPSVWVRYAPNNQTLSNPTQKKNTRTHRYNIQVLSIWHENRA